VGRLIYNQKSKCWMASDGSAWEHILDREVDKVKLTAAACRNIVTRNCATARNERNSSSPS
jgi:hypothetical protein